MLKFVTNTTSQSSLYYVGHSQGTTIAFAEFSRNKIVAKMVKTFYALAPVITVGNTKSPIRLLSNFSPLIKVISIHVTQLTTTFHKECYPFWKNCKKNILTYLKIQHYGIPFPNPWLLPYKIHVYQEGNWMQTHFGIGEFKKLRWLLQRKCHIKINFVLG